MEQEKPEEEKPQTEESEETKVDAEESEESAPEEKAEGEPQPEEKPKEEEHIDYHTPEKPKRTEKEKAEFTLKSVVNRYKELGGDPATVLGEKEETQYVTKRDFVLSEARKIARSDKEVEAIMAWVDKGLSVEDAHLLANKDRVKATFSEMERGNVRVREATGAGQKKPAPRAPKPSDTQLMQWRRAGMVYSSEKGLAEGKFTEEYWDGTRWASRRKR